MRRISIFILCLSACGTHAPYENGPVMKQKDIVETFEQLLEFMEYKPGMAFADVGAGSGALTVMMGSLMDSSVVYIQDINADVLNLPNVDKIVDYYSKQSGRNLRSNNKFELTLGTAFHTNLPDSTFDLVYSNATVHNFISLDSIAADLKKKLRRGGVLYLRDSFKKNDTELTFCPDPTCARPLLTAQECLMVMQRNGFVVVKHAPNMSGHPIFGFAIAEF
jgi:ubiquinone/menaquinone biosynthesis C-methylase UbiE